VSSQNPESVAPRIDPKKDAEPSYPHDLREAEWKCLRARRKAAHQNPPGGAWPWDKSVGLALSGGGIRSATFSLGFLQALADKPEKLKDDPLLTKIDVLSTVSGGGYVGSFLGGLYCKRRKKADLHVDETEKGASCEDVVKDLTDPQSPPLRFLRENGRYLTPGGSGDGMLAGAVALRNFVALHLVLGTFAVLVFLLLEGLLGRGTTLNECLESLHPQFFSPWLVLPVLAALLLVIPAGWAYWIPGDDYTWRSRGIPPWLTTLLVAGAALGGGYWMVKPSGGLVQTLFSMWSTPSSALCCLLALEAFLALEMTLLAKMVAWSSHINKDLADEEEDGKLGPRRRLSIWLRGGVIILLVTLYLALVDTLASGYARWMQGAHAWKFGTYGGLAAGLMALASKAGAIVKFFEGKLCLKPGQTRIPWGVVAGLCAFVLGTAILVVLDILSKGFGYGWSSCGAHGAFHPGWPIVAAVLLSLAFGRTYEFLNESALGPYYSSMLTRAYLGASNEVRQAAVVSPPYVVAGDDIPRKAYLPHEYGGPLHLVNVCLNETQGGESQVIQRDRKGMGMTVGPAGVSVGVRHHACWGEDLTVGHGQDYGVFLVKKPQPYQPEELTMGRWMGISGAAASTGMGQRTRLSFSILCGIFNVRLGYWWYGGVPPNQRFGCSNASLLSLVSRFLFSVQFHLFDELLARFPGTSTRRWYLSDGGHFENLGVYELLRRRIPFIIAVDADADPDTKLSDLENLVRLARVDLQADIQFLSEKKLRENFEDLVNDRILGPLEWLQRGQWEDSGKPPKADRTGYSRCHACLAEVSYRKSGSAAPEKGWLLYVKPTLVEPATADAGTLPLDVCKYHEHHPDFPHETTAHQFFNEPQWESYRKLGQHIGLKLLGNRPAGSGLPLVWDYCLNGKP